MSTQVVVGLWALVTLLNIVFVTLPPHSVGVDTLCAFSLAFSAVNLGAALAVAEREI
jgi:hypothetical protein